MLILSDKHTAKDIELWQDHEFADQIHASSQRMRRMIDQASEAIQSFTADRACYAGVSWGKDSVVLAHLLWETAPHVPLMHLRPTNHNPDCDSVRDVYFTRFPGQPYDELQVDYSEINPLSTREEWDKATDSEWYRVIRKYSKAFGGRHILGIRSDESTGRRIRFCRWGLNSPNGSAPIGRWNTQDVFSYLAGYGLPVHPAYAMLGGGRWQRDRLRVAEIGDSHGTGGGRAEWETEYYGDTLRKLQKNNQSQ